MAKQVFVSPINGEWKVKTVGTNRAAGIYDTKAEAIIKAREVAINSHAEMTIQNGKRSKCVIFVKI